MESLDSRDFDDAPSARAMMESNVVSALQGAFPKSEGGVRLELADVRVENKEHSLAAQKKALIEGRSLNTLVKGKWRLVDEATGSVLDERDDTVMRMPYLTDRGTMVQSGNDVAVSNQMRLKPGVYTRRRKSGEVEAQVNVMPGEGTGFRMWLEPETGLMRMAVKQANIPAYAALKAAGADDESIRKAWGDDIYRINKAKSDSGAIEKMHAKFVGRSGVPGADMATEVREAMGKSRLDPWVVERTLGVKSDRVTPEVLLAGTSKVLAINRGDAEEDDRDDPAFGKVLSVEDFVRERVEKDAGGLAKTLLWRASRDKSLKRVHPGALDPYMRSLMLDSGLVQVMEETNPLSIADQLNRVIKFGEGGLPSKDAVTDEARDVKPGMTGFIDPLAGPESCAVGIDTRLSWRTRKGAGGKMLAEFVNTRTGETEWLSPEDTHGKVVALPGQDMAGKLKVAALRGGRVARVDPAEADYQVPSMPHMYGIGVNMTPMPTGFMPGRAFYSSKYWSQFMPLVSGEAPLVRSATPDGQSDFATHYGRRYATLSSPMDGVVSKVTDGTVTVTGPDGAKKVLEMAKDFPFNRISSLTHRPAVKEGDKVAKGQMLAASNFTDDTGAIAMGRNLRVAVMPYKGRNFEDAWVISEDAARKLATSRLIGFDKETRDGTEVSRSKFVSSFPKMFNDEQLAKLDEDGVAIPGSVVSKGDPLVLAVGARQLSAEDAALGNLHKVLRKSLKDKSEVWPYDFPGIVTDAAMTPRGAFINVKTEPPVDVGDKLSSIHAQKGVVGAVLPPDKMPRDAATGEPYEVLLNPMGVISRMAPNQLVDLALGKVAAKTGKPYVLPQDPPKEGWAEFAKAELAKNEVSDSSDVVDPESGNVARGIGTGVMHVMPFHHIAEKKISGRSTGGYDSNQQPSRGGDAGAKRMGNLELNALLAHGATEVVRDAMAVRGTRNEDFWLAMKLGRPLPEPAQPFIFDKFVATLKSGGINVRRRNNDFDILPLTDKDVDEMAPHEVRESGTVDADTLRPLPGGLFDEKLTGGLTGQRFSHILLPEPIPSPVMDAPIKKVLGLTDKRYRAILSGREELGGKLGGEALQSELAKIDVDKEIERYTNEVRNSRGAGRDNAVKCLRYLNGCKTTGVRPADWIITKVPVMPPIFRPVSKMGGTVLSADMNDMYRDVIEISNGMRALKGEVTPAELADDRERLYDAVSAAYGLGESTDAESAAKGVKGAIRQVVGTNPKFGMFQSRLLGKSVDSVARGVVVPNADMDMDSIGIPEEMAWELYSPFTQRRLVRRGVPPVKAKELIAQRHESARSEMLAEMAARPVLATRAPAWHKFNIMAFDPAPIKGHSIHFSPLVVGGFNMDFDGDQGNFHVPASDRAVAEARAKMYPSSNLFKRTDMKSPQHLPSKEALMALARLTSPPNPTQAPARYKTSAEAIMAYRSGLIKFNDPVEIG